MTVVDAPRPLTIAEANAKLIAPGSRFEVEEILIRGVPTRTWKNGPKTLAEVFEAAERFSDRTFLVLEEDRVSFEGFLRATRVLAGRLAADGVGKGDRVAIVMRNLPEWPVAFFAAAILGAIVTPLNAWWTGPELDFGLSNRRDQGRHRRRRAPRAHREWPGRAGRTAEASMSPAPAGGRLRRRWSDWRT